MALSSALTLAVVYSLGGILVTTHAFKIGSLVALVGLINRMYGPINQLSSMQLNVLTALVSFDRVFGVPDLRPLVTERPRAAALAAAPDGMAPLVEFDRRSGRPT